MKKRNNPHSTTGEEISNFSNVEKMIQPPPHIKLRAQDWPHWESVTNAKHWDSWTTADLEIAAQLARTLADIPRLRDEIDREGDTIIQAGTGNVVLNPKHRLLDSAVKRSISLSRLLQIHALATQGRSSDQSARNKAARNAADTLGGLDDDLIPKSKH